MDFTHRQQREAFHILFLEGLLGRMDPSLFVLKGGLNLRFFFGSPRFSEDMDIDVLGSSVETLKRNGYRVLDDRGFRRSLAAFGISELLVNDPARAKHTATTQRFRVRLVTTAGETWPTKVEFSRRGDGGTFRADPISPDVVRAYHRLAMPCQHYDAGSTVLQKLNALAGRREPQTRDAFDLYVLWLGGHWDAAVPGGIGTETRSLALENLLAFSYADYRGQVLDYLEPETLSQFGGETRWQMLVETVCGLVERT